MIHRMAYRRHPMLRLGKRWEHLQKESNPSAKEPQSVADVDRASLMGIGGRRGRGLTALQNNCREGLRRLESWAIGLLLVRYWFVTGVSLIHHWFVIG